MNDTISTDKTLLPEPIHIDDLEAMDFPPAPWIFDGILPAEGLIAVSGPPESYKTYLTLWAAIRASVGKPLFEEGDEIGTTKAEPSPVLFIEEENTERLIHDRLLLFEREKNRQVYFLIEKGFSMKKESWRQHAQNLIKTLKIKLMVLDPFSSVMGLENENDNAEVAKVMDHVRQDFLSLGVTILFIHHPAKGAEGINLRGAGDILGKVDLHLTLERDEEDEKTIHVKYAKVRIADRSKLKNFDVLLVDDGMGANMKFVYKGKTVSKSVKEEKELRIKLLAVLEDGETYSQKEIAEAVSLVETGRKFRTVFDKLLESGEIRKIGKGKFTGKGFEKPMDNPF